VVTAPRHVDTPRVRTLIAARTFTLGAEPLAPLVAPALPLARSPVARLADAAIGRLPEGSRPRSHRRRRSTRGVPRPPRCSRGARLSTI